MIQVLNKPTIASRRQVAARPGRSTRLTCRARLTFFADLQEGARGLAEKGRDIAEQARVITGRVASPEEIAARADSVPQNIIPRTPNWQNIPSDIAGKAQSLTSDIAGKAQSLTSDITSRAPSVPQPHEVGERASTMTSDLATRASQAIPTDLTAGKAFTNAFQHFWTDWPTEIPLPVLLGCAALGAVATAFSVPFFQKVLAAPEGGRQRRRRGFGGEQ